MTMIMDSPPSKREALRTSRSCKNVPAAQPEEKRMSRRQRLEMEKANSTSARGVGMDTKPPSTRGLALAKSASARWQASRNSNRALDINDDEEVVSMEFSIDEGDDNNKSRGGRRGLPRRTASMDAEERPSFSSKQRRPLQRNKSCDGSSAPHQRVLRRTATNSAVLDARSSSVRRFGSNRMLMDREKHRTKSERHFEAATSEGTSDKPASRPSSRRHLMDNSSDDGARSSRRRPLSRNNSGMEDSSTDGGSRRRLMSRSMSSSSGGGGGTGTSMRRRKPRSSERGPRENSMRDLSHMKDGSSNSQSQQHDDSQSNVVAAIPGRGLDDSSRRRKEPTLSKLSIDELRNRLVGGTTTQEGDCEHEGCDLEENNDHHDSFGSSQGDGHDSFEANWDIGNDSGPLASDLNHDED